MTDQSSPPAIAHGFPLMVPAPDGVDDAISSVMAIHETELDEALRPFGLEVRDLLQPTWMRLVRAGDIEALEIVAGDCCGSGEACSGAACRDENRAENMRRDRASRRDAVEIARRREAGRNV